MVITIVSKCLVACAVVAGALVTSSMATEVPALAHTSGLPTAEMARQPVSVPCLPAEIATEGWADLLFQDEKDQHPWDPTTVISSVAAGLPPNAGEFCTTRQMDPASANCGRTTDTEFLSVSNTPQAAFCTSSDGGPAAGTHQCATGTGETTTANPLTGLICSVAKDVGSGRVNFVCTTMNVDPAPPTGSNFCGIATGSGVASTWNTAASGPYQWCSLDASSSLATNTCTAQSGVAGWCSVSKPQEGKAKCTAMTGSQGTCSTIGGGTSRCSTYTGGGAIAPPGSPGAGGVAGECVAN